MTIQLVNNAKTYLADDISSSATNMTVEDASSFPVLGVGDYFYCTLQRTSGSIEIVKVTSTTGNVFGMTRAQENTTPLTFSSGSLVEMRMTLQNLEDVVDLFVDDNLVSDTAYNATSWNGVTTIAPSKNAVRDIVEALVADSDIGVTVQAYSANLTEFATVNPSENAKTLLTRTFAEMRLDLAEDPLVILTSGQSNVMLAPTYSWTPEDNLYEWNWDEDVTHVGTAFAAPAGTTIKLGQAFANEVAKANPLRKVYLINIGRSGTPIANWLPAGSPDLYAAVKDNVEDALAVLGLSTIDVMLWWQGESDAAAPTNYAADFDTLHTRLRAETWFPHPTPVIMMGVTELCGAEIARFNRYLLDCQTDSARSFVNTADLPVAFWDPLFIAYLHMTGEGYKQAGRLAADAYMSGPRERDSNYLYSPTFHEVTIEDDEATATAVAQLNLVSDAGTATMAQFSTTNGLFPSALTLTAPAGAYFNPTGAFTLASNGNTGISIATSGIPTLTTPVIGAATGTSLNLTGALTAGGNSSVTRNANSESLFTVSNTNVHASADSSLALTSDAGTFKATMNSTLDGLFPSAATVTAPSTMLINPTGTFTLASNGNAGISIATSGIPTLTTPVIGAATGTSLDLTGALTAGGNSSVTRNANSESLFTVSNTNAHASADASLALTSDAGTLKATMNSTLDGLFPSAATVTAPATMLINPTGAFTLASNGNTGISIATSGIPTLTTPVIGAATGTSLDLTGALTAGGNSSVTRNASSSSSFTVSNTTAHASADAGLALTSNAGTFRMTMESTTDGLFPSAATMTAPAGMLVNPTGALTLASNGNTGISIATSGIPTLTTPVIGAATGTSLSLTGLMSSGSAEVRGDGSTNVFTFYDTDTSITTGEQIGAIEWHKSDASGASGITAAIRVQSDNSTGANTRISFETDSAGTRSETMRLNPGGSLSLDSGIVGFTDASSAAAGIVGEVLTSTLAAGSATSLTTATAKTITSISLTAGDWDVSANFYAIPASGTTITSTIGSISQTNNTLDQTSGAWDIWNGSVVSAGFTTTSASTGTYRINVSSTTTVYLVGYAAFSGSTCTGYGRISARRVR